MTQVQGAAVTAKTVARAAGVSQATVSYVINNTPHQRISAPTRERVLKVAAEMGYTPSAAARTLRKGSSDFVLMALPNVPIGESISMLIDHLETALDDAGLALIVRRITARRPISALWRELMPAAVLAVSDIDPDLIRDMRASGVFVAQSLTHPRPDEATIGVPQSLMGRLQVQHLASRGHTQIGYADPADPRLEGFLSLRLEGVRMACVELGLDLPQVQPVPIDRAAAAAAVAAWREAPTPVTGVCAYNDEVAFAVLAGMREHGLTAPRDLAVIGVDNISLSALSEPPLTTIDQNVGLLGDHLAALIRAGIAGEKLPEMPRSEALTVVVRESA